jgi:hypothetical protein
MNTVFRRYVSIAAGLTAWAWVTASALAGDFKVKVELAWGTDDAKPNGQTLQELDPKIREKLSHLRWKNYFVVKSETIPAPHKEPKRFNLSDKCAIEVRDKGDGNVEVHYFNLKSASATKPVDTVCYPIQKFKDGHVFVNAGDSKEKWGDAWLIILTAGE